MKMVFTIVLGYVGFWIGSYFHKRYLLYDMVWLISYHEDADTFITFHNHKK